MRITDFLNGCLKLLQKCRVIIISPCYLAIIFRREVFKALYSRVRVGGGANRVLRGGSWANNPANCRCANRNANDPRDRNENAGVRLASSLCRQKCFVYG